MTARVDWPPLNVKPKDWKGFAIDILLLVLLIALGATQTVLGIIFGLIFLVAYFSMNRNYYWNFIQGKIDDGYGISEEQQSFLANAGINVGDREKSSRKGFEKILSKIPEKFQIPTILGIGALCLLISVLFTLDFENNINGVKQGYLDFDTSITVGNAFDNYAYFTEVEWQEFETDQGRKIVEVVGNFDINTFFFAESINLNVLEDPDAFADVFLGPFSANGFIPEDDLSVIRERNDWGWANTIYPDIQQSSVKYRVQFIINADDTFELNYAELIGSFILLSEDGSVLDISHPVSGTIVDDTFL
ncbi:MAG: hypothetical protein ACR2PY_09205 [Salinispira sp.]